MVSTQSSAMAAGLSAVIVYRTLCLLPRVYPRPATLALNALSQAHALPVAVSLVLMTVAAVLGDGVAAKAVVSLATLLALALAVVVAVGQSTVPAMLGDLLV